jgi:hypothetical protein
MRNTGRSHKKARRRRAPRATKSSHVTCGALVPTSAPMNCSSSLSGLPDQSLGSRCEISVRIA